jgi:DNA (cytosine-5)-methyltransferase 1
MLIRTFDLFCGAGGSSCGARMAGAEVVGALDMWPLAAETFERNFPDARVFRRRLTADFGSKKISSKVGPIDLLLASPECTNHSVAKGNKHRCEESRRTAFQVIKFAKTMQPRWIVIENVVSMQRWDAYGNLLDRLNGLRYYIKELKLNAQDFGVPQNRRRLYIIADRERPAQPPEPDTKRRVPAQTVLGRGEGRQYSFEFSPLESPRRAEATLARARRGISDLGPNAEFLLVYYGSDAAGGWQRLDRPLRTITTLDRFALVRPNVSGHEMRMLQPPELAAAMGFPEDYHWPRATRRDHIKLIGNAVPPPVMKRIVMALTSENSLFSQRRIK